MRLRLLEVLLRAGGTILVTAFAAMLLPVDWMAATHEWLGLGAFPRAPVVDYLARSVSASADGSARPCSERRSVSSSGSKFICPPAIAMLPIIPRVGWPGA